MNFYELSAKDTYGDEIKMEQYKGKVVLIVNTASKCGFSPQFEELEQLYQEFAGQGFEILGFPSNQFANQEPGTNEEVRKFCQLNYGVTFTMFEKIDVNGANAHPVYQFLTSQAKGILSDAIKWNFTKFLIDAQGNVFKRYAPTVSPMKMKDDIQKLLQATL